MTLLLLLLLHLFFSRNPMNHSVVNCRLDEIPDVSFYIFHSPFSPIFAKSLQASLESDRSGPPYSATETILLLSFFFYISRQPFIAWRAT